MTHSSAHSSSSWPTSSSRCTELHSATAPMCIHCGGKHWACAWVLPAVYRSSSGPSWPSAGKPEHWKTSVSPLCHSVTVRSGYTSPYSSDCHCCACQNKKHWWMKWPLTVSCFSFAAFPKNDSTSEFLEGKQLEQHRESRGACGAREGGGSVHRHAHRHGLHSNDMGDGKPGVTAWRAGMNT